jgi:hypothetical protein
VALEGLADRVHRRREPACISRACVSVVHNNAGRRSASPSPTRVCDAPSFREVTETPWDAARGTCEVARIVRELHVEIAGRCVEALEFLGRYVAGRSGLSLALDDFLPPAAAREPIEEAHREWAHWRRVRRASASR